VDIDGHVFGRPVAMAALMALVFVVVSAPDRARYLRIRRT
jgi:hypothetical protein